MQSLEQQLPQSHTLYAVVFMFFIFIIFLVKWIFRSPKVLHKNLPPSPPRLPVIGNLHQLGVHQHRSLWSLAQRYGPLMLLHLGSKPALLVSSADAAREVLKTHDTLFSGRPRASNVDRLVYNKKTVLTAPCGAYWRKMKTVYVLHLLSKKKVHSFQRVRQEEISLLLEKIRKSSSMSLSINLSEMFMSISKDVICRATFGRKYNVGEEGRTLKEMLTELMKYNVGEGGRQFKEILTELMKLIRVGGASVGNFIPLLCWVDKIIGTDTKVEKVAKEFEKFLEGVIEEHVDRLKRENRKESDLGKEEKDFVDVLLEIQKENVVGSIIDRDSIKALILELVMGGTDTTLTVLEWAMAEILRDPKVLMKAQNEIRNYGNSRPLITLEDLDKLLYLKAVIKEILRLHPPAPLLLPRMSTEDVKLQGYDIAAGTMVIINAWAIGRDVASWDQPEDFRPERFLGTSIDFNGNDFQLIPFGSGRRICPGMLFGTITIEFVLANLLLKFNWSLPNGMRGEDLDMSESTGVTVHKKHPLIAIATLTPSS